LDCSSNSGTFDTVAWAFGALKVAVESISILACTTFHCSSLLNTPQAVGGTLGTHVFVLFITIVACITHQGVIISRCYGTFVALVGASIAKLVSLTSVSGGTCGVRCADDSGKGGVEYAGIAVAWASFTKTVSGECVSGVTLVGVTFCGRGGRIVCALLTFGGARFTFASIHNVGLRSIPGFAGRAGGGGSRQGASIAVAWASGT